MPSDFASVYWRAASARCSCSLWEVGTRRTNKRCEWGKDVLGLHLSITILFHLLICVGRRIWYSCTGYVSIFSPLINYGFGKINGGISSWRYMFYFAGALTIVWGLLLFYVLPPDPIRAKGFGERERYILVARLRSNNSGVRNTHYKMEQVGELALDVKFWLVFAIAFLCMIANGPISTFVPIIINGFGFSTLNSLLLTMPAGAYGGTVQLIMPYLAYKFKNCRTWIVFGAQLGTTLAALLLWLLPRSAKGALLFAAYILPSVGGGYAVLMGLQIANTAGYTKRSIASSGLYIGYCLGITSFLY